MNKIISLSLIAASATMLFSGCNQQPQPTFEKKTFVLPQPKKVEPVKPLLASKVELKEFSVNKPLLFRPFDKTNNKKKVYLSYVGLTTQQLDLKKM